MSEAWPHERSREAILRAAALLATEDELRIVAANEAMRLSAGCSEQQLSRLRRPVA